MVSRIKSAGNLRGCEIVNLQYAFPLEFIVGMSNYCIAHCISNGCAILLIKQRKYRNELRKLEWAVCG